jgi:hypothetical protein
MGTDLPAVRGMESQLVIEQHRRCKACGMSTMLHSVGNG